MSGAAFAGPHQGQPLAHAGRPLPEAAAAMVMIHGRGATAESILELAREGLVDVTQQAAFSPIYVRLTGNELQAA